MSADPTAAGPDPLPPLERRALGVLVEKQKTSRSPDAYPMTLNALTTGCNQKSNRDPVLDLSDDEVEETLGRLQRRGMVSKLVGGRTDRWRHLLYEAWTVSKVEMAVLAELLLRGPQTVGDLRGRASRMDEIADLDELRRLLDGLAARKLVVYLTPPDRRGAAVTHGFHTADELDQARAKFAGGGAGSADDFAPGPRPTAPPPDELIALTARLQETEERVRRLEEGQERLRERVEQLVRELGGGAVS